MGNKFTPEIIAELTKPLDVSVVAKRKQSGRDLSYIEGWHAIAEANRIFGFEAWNRETIYCKEVCRVEKSIGENKNSGWKIGYEAKVRITIGDTVREGTGHGSGSMSDLFDCIESACKEAETDAMKRALMMFGNPFGLALYDKKQRNVEDGAAREQAERLKKEADKKNIDEKHYIPIPLTVDGGDGDWLEYADLLMNAIRELPTKGAFIAFRATNSANMDHLQEADADLRKQVSEYASKKMKDEGWNKKAPVPPTHPGG